jgi:hypothetical protein
MVSTPDMEGANSTGSKQQAPVAGVLLHNLQVQVGCVAVC